MFGKTMGGALLVAGTCIGAGMLSLPVATSSAGFFPTIGAFIACWCMMTLTALYMLEVSLKFPEQTNLISMARATLGRPGEIIAWFSYVFFLYAVMTAYTAGGAEILSNYLGFLNLSDTTLTILLTVIFGGIVYLGTLYVDWMNRLIVLGLIICYIGLVSGSFSHIQVTHFSHIEAKYLLGTAPLLVTSFGFHLLIPSLKNYLHSDAQALRRAIIFGSMIPLAVYLLWEAVTLGVVPLEGASGLLAMNQSAKPVVALTTTMSKIIDQKSIYILVNGFGLCAILSSLVGVALGMFDFFADGFSIEKTTLGKLKLVTLVFMPPLVFVLGSKQARSIFLLALQYAGVFAAILLVILPALMAWCTRVSKDQPFRVAGGSLLQWLCILCGIGVIGLEIMQEMSLLPKL